MKPAKFKKIRKENLPEDPPWLKATVARVKKSSLAKMSEEEKSQWANDLVERARKKSQAQSTTD